MDRVDGHHVSRRRRRWGLYLTLAAILLAVPSGVVYADDASDREYKVKAAFIYNFLKFVEGGRFAPSQGGKADKSDPNNVIVIGILGVPPSRAAFEEFQDKQVANRSIVVRWFKGFEELKDEDKKTPQQHPDIEQVRKCHVLFLCPSEKPFLQRVLPHLQDSGMLTVGDVPVFLEAGGAINLFIEDKKVRFEINLAATARAKLAVRSSLLRLAVRTIEQDRLTPREDQEKSGGNARP